MNCERMTEWAGALFDHGQGPDHARQGDQAPFPGDVQISN
jgi:hypothetical protein